jgi:hypothetical protein
MGVAPQPVQRVGLEFIGHYIGCIAIGWLPRIPSRFQDCLVVSITQAQAGVVIFGVARIRRVEFRANQRPQLGRGFNVLTCVTVVNAIAHGSTVDKAGRLFEVTLKSVELNQRVVLLPRLIYLNLKAVPKAVQQE